MYNERIEVRLSSPERYFTKCYHDFMDCDLLTGEEKIVFLSLKRFLDVKSDNGKVFPTIKTIQRMTGWGNQKIIKYIKNLVKKGVVKSIRQGLSKPNIYILSDYPKMWTCDSIEEMAAVADNKGKKPLTVEEHIAELERMGYKVEVKKEVKEKKLVSGSHHTTDTSNQKTNLDNDTTDKPESQVVCSMSKVDTSNPESQVVCSMSKVDTSNSESQVACSMSKVDTSNPESQERYSMSDLKEFFEYKGLIAQNPEKQKDIEIIFDLLYDTVNTKKPTIRINGEEKPTMVVIGKLMKLQFEDFPYVIDKYHEQTGRIKNVKAYLLTILYHARDQSHLDMMNLGHYNGDF